MRVCHAASSRPQHSSIFAGNPRHLYCAGDSLVLHHVADTLTSGNTRIRAGETKGHASDFPFVIIKLPIRLAPNREAVWGSLPSDEKKIPIRRQPHWEVDKRYRSSRYKMAATSTTSFESTRNLKSNSIKYLLSLQVARSSQKLWASCVLANVPPRKEAASVYMEVA